jgi:glycosyltransferase involved in cell wall biosynthesis
LAEIFNKVVEQVPNVQLQLVGKDVMDVFEHASTYQLFEKRLTAEAKKQVVHIPQVPYAEVKVFLQKATVVVLPSFAEAFPMTWLEAMAMGKALVTSNIGWASEVMIDGTTGYTEHPTNHKAYANKIVTLLTNKNVNCTFGKQAKAHIETNFSHDKICVQNLHFYKSLL